MDGIADIDRLAWRTSSFSGGATATAASRSPPSPTAIAVRDTKDRSRTPHIYTAPGLGVADRRSTRRRPHRLTAWAPIAQGIRTSTHTLWWSEVSFSRASGSLATGQKTALPTTESGVDGST